LSNDWQVSFIMRRYFDTSGRLAVKFLKLPPSISEQTETIKSKKCTFTLHGPWGEHSAQTFIRVTFFNFPSSYPRPSSLSRKSRPSAEIEKGSSDLPKGQRRVLIRDLRKILAKEAPALELCLLYLLGKYELPLEKTATPGDAWGDDDDDGALVPGVANENHLPVALLIDHHTLPRSRHTQAMFGPNGDYRNIPRGHISLLMTPLFEGQLVLLSRQAIKVVVPSTRAASPAGSFDLPEIIPSTGGTLLDAMWALSKLSTDAAYIKRDYVDIGRPRRANFTDNLIMEPYVVCASPTNTVLSLIRRSAAKDTRYAAASSFD
jgi:hypothetical protein